MTVETIKESIHVNKMVATKKEIIMVEGDMIVPDSKPDILNTISTSGIVSVYKKEVLDGKVRIDGNINTYIMYMADDNDSRTRGINTDLDFSETIKVTNAKEEMDCKVRTNLKSIEARVINGRKVGIKATLEVEVDVYSNEEIEFVKDIADPQSIKMLKENIVVNSLIGTGENKIFAKDTIAINTEDNLAEILNARADIVGKDVKVSYNKILTKSEVEVNILYLTEDNRIESTVSKIPVVGFIDIPNVTEENICDVNYEIRNVVIKPNGTEEHSIYVEIEVGVAAFVYEEKEIQLIQDLYSPSKNIDFTQKKVTTITGKNTHRGIKQIREKIMLDNIENNSILNVNIEPIVEKMNINGEQLIYDGELELKFIFAGQDMQVDIKTSKIAWEYSVEKISNLEKSNINLEIEVLNHDFIIQDGGNVNCNIDLQMDVDISKNVTMNVIDEIEDAGIREAEDYSILMYIVKKGDSLWKIAKEFGSSVEDIVRTNGIEDENNIMPGQKIFIPHYSKTAVMSNV